MSDNLLLTDIEIDQIRFRKPCDARTARGRFEKTKEIVKAQHTIILDELKAMVEHHHPTANIYTALEKLIARMEKR